MRVRFESAMKGGKTVEGAFEVKDECALFYIRHSPYNIKYFLYSGLPHGVVILLYLPVQFNIKWM